ncbi:MAG: serine/threonine-protein kinase, partial [Pirellula sp.]
MRAEKVCPHCGGAISKLAPEEDLGKTIDAFAGTATIDLPASLDIVGESSKTLGDANGTIDIASNASLDIPKESQSSSGRGITDVTVMTIDLPKDGGGELELDAMTATIDSQAGSTLATGAFSMDSVAIPVTATIHLNAKDQTIGLDDKVPATPTVHRGRGAKTHVEPEVESAEESILKTISRRSLSRSDDRVIGSTPDYTIVKKLGEGGMGVVYAAIQKALDRKVAIKAIKSGVEVSFDAKKKFYYEARITGDLDHPNIVPIHEIGTQDDGTLFYSMKMVDGKPWQDAIGSRTRDENIEIFMKVCDAVAFAHSRNVIHRDLKPENVMIGAFGEVLVMDWGLAIQLPAKHSFSMSGTPAYMSPEMA